MNDFMEQQTNYYMYLFFPNRFKRITRFLSYVMFSLDLVSITVKLHYDYNILILFYYSQSAVQ